MTKQLWFLVPCCFKLAYAVTVFPVTHLTIERAEVKPALYAIHSSFVSTTNTDGLAAGLVGDGKTDNTLTFRRLFSKPGQNIRISRGDYLTGSFEIPSNTVLTLDAGVTIRDNGQLKASERFVRMTGKHIKIIGNGAVIHANRADYPAGQQRHGVFIFGAADVVIDDIKSEGAGGDGFYIGGPPKQPATDISITNCAAINNRRQGLSITNARRVDIVNSQFLDTHGTSPQAGIDLEPNAPIDYLDGISIIQVLTANNRGGGIILSVNRLNQTSTPINVTFIDHQSVNEKYPFRSFGQASVPGTARYISVQ